MTKELVMFARRGAPLDREESDLPPRSGRVPDRVEEERFEATAYRLVALVGAAVTIIGALAVVLARWRYANPPHHTPIDLPGTFLVTFGTQLGVTALAFGIPLALGGAALWLRARPNVTAAVAVPTGVPRAVVVERRSRRRGSSRTSASRPFSPAVPPSPPRPMSKVHRPDHGPGRQSPRS